MTNFRQATFTNVSIYHVRLLNTSFANCNLTRVKGIDAIEHLGPSHVDFATLRLSKNLTPRFLRQIGIEQGLAANLLKAVTNESHDLAYSCFLSHSSADKEFCDRLYERLVDEGLRVWYAPEEMKGGELVSKQLLSAINQHDKVLVILSEQSLKSNWVSNELRWALKREEKIDEQVLFPLSLVPFSRLQDWELVDPDTGIDIAARIRSYFLPDFSSWTDDHLFEKALKQLLKALRPSLTGEASKFQY